MINLGRVRNEYLINIFKTSFKHPDHILFVLMPTFIDEEVLLLKVDLILDRFGL